jgi:undecaprenyl-diphosphatase
MAPGQAVIQKDLPVASFVSAAELRTRVKIRNSRPSNLTGGWQGLGFFALVNAPLILPQHCPALATTNPFGGVDQEVAGWFHTHLTHTFGIALQTVSEFGSAEWIGGALFFLVLFFIFKRRWPSVLILIVAVPGGMLLNELVKILVHRQRPFLEGPFVDWSGYSFASGHTIGATLLYGQLALFILPAMKSRHWRVLTVFAAALLILSIGFSRIALGAHYLTDVLAAIIFGVLWLMFCLVVGKSRQGANLPSEMADIVALPDTDQVVPVPVEHRDEPAQNLLS